MMKRIFAFVMALVMTFSLFAVPASAKTYAKGDMNGDGKIDSADAIYLLYHILFGADRYPLAGEEGWVDPTPEKDTTLDLEKKDFNGHEFRFLARKSSYYHLDTHEIYAEELTGDKINDAVFTRNAKIEREYNCAISEEKTSSPASAARDPLLAGEYLVDFLFDEARLLRVLASSNLLADVSATENMNLEKGWYDEAGIKGLNLGGKVFFVVGDGCILDDGAAYIMRYNKDFVAEYDSSIDLQKEAREGKWTVDRMYELMTATAKDLNGDGLIFPGEDRFGYNGELATNWGHVAACGVTLSQVDDRGNYVIPLTPRQELLDVWASLKPILTSHTRLIVDGGLASGDCTFTTCGVSALLKNDDSTYDLGVLPMPKLHKDQEQYYTTVYFSQLCAYSIPLTVNNADDYAYNGFTSGVEQAAYFLEIFSYYSMNVLTPAFHDQLMAKRAVHDNDTAEIIEMVLENKIYDPVVGYNLGGMDLFGTVGSVQGGIPGHDKTYDSLVSAYESRVSAARKALDNYLKSIHS